jgi:hypothetical protein
MGRTFDSRFSVVSHAAVAHSGDAAGFASALAAVGDYTGDGRPEILVGSPVNGSGRVWLYSPAQGTLLDFSPFGETSGDGFGAAVVGVSDVTADGKPELAVGAPSAGGTGIVYVYSGELDGSVAFTLAGPAAGQEFGCALATTGGSPAGQLAIGARAAGGAGKVYVYQLSGQSLVRELSGGQSGDRFGETLAAHDLNGDGTRDLLVGAPGAAAGTGRVYAYAGEVGGPLLYALNGEAAGDGFGGALAVGDVNGDGLPDLVVGAPGAASGAGRVYLFSGAPGNPLLHSWSGETAGDAFGTAVAASDLDRDGRQEILVGAPNAGGVGKVYVFSGTDYSRLGEQAGTAAGGRHGAAVIGIPSAKRDAVAGYAVGAPSATPGTLTAYEQLAAPAPPGRPKALSAVALSATTAALTWTNSAPAVERFLIERRRFARGWEAAPESPAPAGARFLLLAGLSPRTTYLLRVKAQTARGDSRWSAEVAVTTGGP